MMRMEGPWKTVNAFVPKAEWLNDGKRTDEMMRHRMWMILETRGLAKKNVGKEVGMRKMFIFPWGGLWYVEAGWFKLFWNCKDLIFAMVSIAFGGSVFLFCFRAFGAYIHNTIYMSIEYFIMRIHLNSEVSVCVLYDSYFPFFFSKKSWNVHFIISHALRRTFCHMGVS